jgi:hypothetical protein
MYKASSYPKNTTVELLRWLGGISSVFKKMKHLAMR